jgi:hypothetical protein
MAGFIDNSLYIPGAYKTNTCKVGDENVQGIMLEFNTYESLTSNVITADITLADTFNLLSNIPIKEGTIVEFEAGNIDGDTNVPETGSIKHKFEVVKIINHKTIKQDLQVYTLILASSGWSNNIKQRISKSFKQKKYSEIVQEVFSKYFDPSKGLDGSLDSKSIDVEETEGMYNIVVPYWKPLTLFNWLAARSIKGKACNFLFWEDLDQFNFKSIDKLMSAGPVATYYQQTQNIAARDKTSAYFNIEEVNFRDTADILFYGMTGIFGNRMIEVDYHEKIITDFSSKGKSGGCVELSDEFDYQSSFGSIKHADSGNPLVSGGISGAFKSDSRYTVVPKHLNIYNNMKEYDQKKWLRERISQRASLDYFGLDAWAIGSFVRKVGDKITFDYHSPEVQEGDPKEDTRFAKNYLVKAIRRKFNQTNYMMVMDLIKDNTL